MSLNFRHWLQIMEEYVTFPCKNLHELVLKNAWLSTNGLSTAMLKLTSLTLEFVRLDDEDLEKVNSCCPYLQNLNLILVGGLKNPRIDLMHLRTIRYVGSSLATTAELRLIRAPNLTKVEVGFGRQIAIMRWDLDLGSTDLSGQPLSLKFQPSTPTSKRKRRASSPTPSANSFTGENSVQVPMSSRKKLDSDNWSYENTEIFIQIMLEEARKDRGTNSNKRRTFTSLQWAAILEELKNRTHKADYTPVKIHQKFDRLKKDYRLFKDLTERSGMGWDPVSQTVTASSDVWLTYLQANKDAAKFIGKGLDHCDLLHELVDGSLATGVFGQPSPLGAPSLEQEQALRNQGKAIKFNDSTFSDGRKRMSDGSGGPSSKSMRCEQREAYDRVAFANQKKGEYFETLTEQRLAAKNYSIENCLQAMNPLKPFVSDTAFWTAYDKLLEGVQYREGFLKLTSDGQLSWISRFGSGN
ncbi:hypothetical protein RHGRI_013102 [Rhododendron griersonianum]|uniref:Myb/SANT-like domain-containing protein n=1 Tax=Rhododendron griersonianum TaxID=479676 RepID=A0AAV6K4L7_9ERIC|nr:hypothetical protein RHGRI_013102 [Rhododendron griersonianum]